MTLSTKSHIMKKAQLTKLQSTKTGADIATLIDKLGWLQHTTRAAISGLSKAGITIIDSRPAGGGLARYRIHSETAAATPEVSNGA